MKLYKLRLKENDHIGLNGTVVAAMTEDDARLLVATSDYVRKTKTSRWAKDDQWWVDDKISTCVEIGLADPYLFPHPEIVLIDVASE